MTLYIDTTLNNKIKIELKDEDNQVVKLNIKTDRDQAEKFVPGIMETLKKAGAGIEAIKKILINNKGGTFSSLRIGVVTANALGYALNIPVEEEGQEKDIKKKDLYIVKPEYNKEPNITKKTTRQLINRQLE